MGLRHCRAAPQCLLHQPQPPVARGCRLFQQRGRISRWLTVPVELCFRPLQRTQRLLQCFGEIATDRHGFAHALHGGSEHIIGAGELLKGESRHLHHDVVQGGFEGGRSFLGDVVGNFVQGVANG